MSNFTTWFKEEVPSYLHSGHTYQTLSNFPMTSNSYTMKPTAYVCNDDDLQSLLVTLRFWRVTNIPDEAMLWILSTQFTGDKGGLLSIFGVAIPSLRILLHLSVIPRGSWMAYTMRHGDLQVLVHLHQVQLCAWSKKGLAKAIQHNHFNCVTYAIQHGCPAPRNACDLAAEGGHINCLQYLFENGHQMSWDICEKAVRGSMRQYPTIEASGVDFRLFVETDVLQYVCEQGGANPTLRALHIAVKHGHMRSVKYVFTLLGQVSDSTLYLTAAKYAQLDCLRYFHDNHLPWHRNTMHVLCQRLLKTTTARHDIHHVEACLQYCADHHCVFNWLEIEQLKDTSHQAVSQVLQRVFSDKILAAKAQYQREQMHISRTRNMLPAPWAQLAGAALINALPAVLRTYLPMSRSDEPSCYCCILDLPPPS